MMMKFLVLALVLSGPSIASATKPTDAWQTAKLVSYNQQEITDSAGSQTTGRLADDGSYSANTTSQSWTSLDCTVVIDDGRMLYFGKERLNFRWSHKPQFTENEQVRYTLKGDHLTVIDDAGKEVKLKVFKKRLKE